MSLAKVQRGPVRGAQKIVIYGPEGIGKSTLASFFPSPLFLDCEGGTKQLDVERINITSLNEITQACAEIPKSDYRTLVIDTADWCEAVMIQAMLRRDGHKSIEDYGYGKGYTEAQNEFAKLLSAFSTVVNAGIHVVILAHAAVVKFEQPESGQAFDRHQLKLTKKSLPLLKEWADMVLFLNWDVRIAKDSKTGKARGVGGKKRILFTEHSATWDAKNRHELPETIAVSEGASLPPELENAIRIEDGPVKPAESKPAEKKKPTAEAKGLSAGEIVDKAKKELGATNDVSNLSAALQSFHANIASKGSEKLVNDFLVSRGKITEGQTWRGLDDDYAQKAADHHEKFITTLLEFRYDRDQAEKAEQNQAEQNA